MNAEQVLRALKVGSTIDGESGQKVFNRSVSDAITNAATAISALRGQDANGERYTFWITGQPGNGKTQTIRQLVHQLPRISGTGKFPFTVIDLGKDTSANSVAGLPQAIVREFLFSGVLVGGLKEVEDSAKQGFGDTSTIESVAFGADVLSFFAGFPPVSLIASRGYKGLVDTFLFKRWRIKKGIYGRWGKRNPQLANFLAAWAEYVLDPRPIHEDQITKYLSDLANQSRLFDLFGYAMQSSKYTTLVLVFDELKQVTLDALKTLWDPAINPSPGFDHKLNLVLILTARDDIHQSVMKDPALKRRFSTTPNGHYQLAGPNIQINNSSDDFNFAVSKINELLNDCVHMKRGILQEDLDPLHQQLAERGGITWQELWQAVIPVMVI